MYDVSDSFKIAMKKSAQKRSLRGTIAGIDFTQNNVLQGTFSITNQCSNSSDIQIGQTYVGELKATFRGVNIQRNSWKGKEIVPYQGLYIDEKGAFEEVSLGHYFVDSANWSRAGVSVTAYDAMSKFDKELKINSSSGTWYDFVSFCCSQCGVEFALSKEDAKKFVNANNVLEIYQENEMETYRDLLSWCAQVAGANAMMNRDGKLTLKAYGGEVCDVLNDRQRLDGGSISDFNTYYTGISFVDLGKQTTSYYAAERDDGLTMNLGGNPLLQLGGDKEVEARRTNVLNAVQNINYTPMTIKINTPFVYDLMDVIELEGGIVGNDCITKSTITKYTWQFAGDFEIVCSGSNPAIASGKSKVDKDISNLSNQVDSSKIVTYDFVNAKEINVGSEKENVVSIRFTSKIKATAMFLAEILIDVSTDSKALLEIFYRLNNEYIESFKPVQTYESGKQILTLYYPLLSLPDSNGNIFEVFFSMSGGTAKIDVGSALATITGQGLLALYYTPKWDGTITIEETIEELTVKNNDVTLKEMSENVSCVAENPPGANISETLGLLSFSSPVYLYGITDTVEAGCVIKASSINAENKEVVKWNPQFVNMDGSWSLITTYSFESKEQAIDSGRMSVLDMDFTRFATVSDVTLSGYTPPADLVRFDDPDATWEQIGAMADAYYNDEITLDDIKQYWSIGDKRSVDLSAMSATGVGESHREQTVQFAIADFEHDDLTTPINGHTKALVTLTQVDCLMDAASELNNSNGSNDTEKGYMNSGQTNSGGWKSSARRSWCNSIYYNALPEMARTIVKDVNKKTSSGSRNASIAVVSDKVFLSSEIETFGALTYSASGEGTQYQYFKESTNNRYKMPMWTSEYPTQVYWLRSPNKNNAYSFCCVGGKGQPGEPSAELDRGIAPLMCL